MMINYCGRQWDKTLQCRWSVVTIARELLSLVQTICAAFDWRALLSISVMLSFSLPVVRKGLHKCVSCLCSRIRHGNLGMYRV
jgi:hypothetical protein